MKVKATKVMAEMLNKKFKEHNDGYDVSLEKMSERRFSVNVDLNSFDHDDDYDYKTGQFNVICVMYPLDYYACNRYLTTKDLVRAFQKSDKTLDGFAEAVYESVRVQKTGAKRKICLTLFWKYYIII